ncbi:MAG TPA: GNAT family N-acetyltransferase [Pyrinomonadaceae bacterium]|nr:GNAT family N-acetyltransferase [Pyrinomonadaceae bacterium]
MTDSQPSQAITTRPATADDDLFLREVYKSSRGDDLRGLGWDEDRISEFLEMQYDAQRHFFENDYQNASDEVVLLDAKPAGRLMVERREHEIRCIDLALLPAYRNRGLGTTLVQNLQAEAAAEKKSLRLQVIRFNRAVNLLERLGFIRTSETGTHFQMEWTP